MNSTHNLLLSHSNGGAQDKIDIPNLNVSEGLMKI